MMDANERTNPVSRGWFTQTDYDNETQCQAKIFKHL